MSQPIDELRGLGKQLAGLPRHVKRAIAVAADLAIGGGVLWLLISLRYAKPYITSDLDTALVLAAAPVTTVTVFAYGGLYKLVTRYLSYRGAKLVAQWALASGLGWALLVLLSGQSSIPRSVVLGYAPLTALLAIATRLTVGRLLLVAETGAASAAAGRRPRNVVIYGAGPAGVHLADELRSGGDLNPVAFVDPSRTLWGQNIQGLKVHRPQRLARIVEQLSVDEVIVALPGDMHEARRAALQQLEPLAVEFRVLPDVADIASGRLAIDSLRALEALDLLGRKRVEPMPELVTRAASAKTVLVTGAGGSIGSELVRQLLRLEPRALILLDSSEPALYAIEEEVRTTLAKLTFAGGRSGPEIVCVLGSVLDAALLARLFREHTIETVYHAAAYKHVPIVEHNPLVALANNTLGTKALLGAATAAGVERFVLISTDKAVRPTNVMGASKRMAELVLQAQAAETSPGKPAPVVTAVRFGNVLDSSGSVVRKFRQQIRAGGPVTVTHPEVTRFFMSVEEAAELVIQAGELAKGGEVFLLDMGEPVKIDDLARLMIRGSGLEVRSDEHPDGDIAIAYVGLRPGEKLYEELLVGDDAQGTAHPRIMRSLEPGLPLQRIEHELKVLAAAIATGNVDSALAVLMRCVEDFSPQVPAGMITRPGDLASQRTVH